MTNRPDDKTFAQLTSIAQNGFWRAVAHGDKEPEGLALLMEDGSIVEGFSLPRISRRDPAVNAAQTAISSIGVVFGEAAMQDQTVRPGQAVIVAVVATAIEADAVRREKIPETVNPTFGLLSDLAQYKGAQNLRGVKIVSPNTEMSRDYPLPFK